MPAPSLTQRLANRPSRSYLGAGSDAGDINDEQRSVASYQSRGQDSNASFSRRLTGNNDTLKTGYSPRRESGRFTSMPNGILRGSRSAASDIGASRTYDTLPISRPGGLQRNPSIDSRDSRRSVTFSDLNPALFDDSSPRRDSRLGGQAAGHPSRNEIMSEAGGYRRPGGVRRTPSIMSDTASDAGSVSSLSRRVRRGSRTEQVTGVPRSPSSSSQWHNSLGGAGLSAGAPKSSSNPLTALVKRKSSGKHLDLANAQPSRRYTLQPTSPAKSSPLGTAEPQSASMPAPPVIEPISLPLESRNNADTSRNSSPSSSEASFNMRTVQHSRHSAKQREKSGLKPLSASTSTPHVTFSDSDASTSSLKRSATTSNATSKKSASRNVRATSETASAHSTPTSTQSTAAGQAPTAKLQPSILKNTLLAAPPSTTSTRKAKPRSAEQIVEALSKAGILDRVMEVVNEVDEDDISSAGDKASKNGSRRSSMAPSISETTNQQVQPPTFMVTSATVPDLAKQAESQPVIPNATIETMPASDAPERQKQTGREKETVAPPKQEELPLNTKARRAPMSLGLTARSASGGIDVSTIMAMSAKSASANPTQDSEAQPRSDEVPQIVTDDSQLAQPSPGAGLPLANQPLASSYTERDAFFTPPSEIPNPLEGLHTSSPPSNLQTELQQEEAAPTATEQSTLQPAAVISQDSPEQPDAPILADGDSRPTNGPAAAEEEVLPQPVEAIEVDQESQTADTQIKRVPSLIIPAGTLPQPSWNTPLRLESVSMITGSASGHVVSRLLEGTVLTSTAFTPSAVVARITWNKWQTYEEVQSVISGPASAELSRWQFSWNTPPGSQEMEVQMALRLEDGSGQVHWDNNSGSNYYANLPSSRAVTPQSTPPRSRSNTPVADTSTPTTTVKSPPVPPRSPDRQSPVPSRSYTNGSVHSQDTSVQPAASMSVPPRVFVTRTISDERRRESVIYSPDESVSRPQNDVFGQEATPSGSQAPQPNGASPGPPVSEIPFPNHKQQDAPSSVSSYSRTTTPAASINGDARPSAAVDTSTPPKSRTTSHTNEDSPAPTFTYPSRRRGSSPSHQRSPTETGAVEMPNILSALDARPQIADDLSGMYLLDKTNGKPPTMSANEPVSSDLLRANTQSSEHGSTSQHSVGGMTIPSGGYLSGVRHVRADPATALASGKITLPKSNSTMRSLTVTSNAAQTLNRSFFRNNQNTKLRQDPNLPSHLQNRNAARANITYSNLAPVPHKIRSDECLVQVFACAVDFWDRAKVEILHSRGQGYGFIPGRAFVGKVLETGREVDATKVSKGSFVYGLQDLKRSGALADYLTVQRGLLTQAPNGCLSLEQIATVALSGISAYQAMDELCSTLERGSKLIILNAHEGVGAIALQLITSLRTAGDLWIVAHYPPDFTDGDVSLKALGASETLCGEVLHAMSTLRESSYDAVLDTIGGRKVYDTMKHVLHDNGYFVTTVGDALSTPTQKPQWRKSLKALFGRKDKREKNIRYWFPEQTEHDQRLALDRLRAIAEAGQLKPAVRRVYKLEDGPNAFKGANEQAVIMLLDHSRQ